MNEELKLYLEMLIADLEVEVDLHGGRTTRARTLRELITYTEREWLASLKSDSCSCVGFCTHALRQTDVTNVIENEVAKR